MAALLIVGGGAIVSSADAESPPDPSTANLEPERRGPALISVTSADLGLEAELRSGRLDQEAEISEFPLASSISGKVPGSRMTYTLDILDSAADLNWIIDADGLDPSPAGHHVGHLGDATEIVGKKDGVKFSLVLDKAVTVSQADALVDGLRFREVQR